MDNTETETTTQNPEQEVESTKKSLTGGDVESLFSSLNQARRKYEMRWYLIDNFWENNHFVKSLNQLGQLEPLKFPKGIQIRPVPRAKKQLKAMVNNILKNDPKWVVYPRVERGELPEQYKDHVKRVGQWFEDLWSFLYVKDQVREMVTNALKFNVGYIEIGGDGQGNIFIDSYEPYDIWHDAGLKSLKEADVLIKGVTRSLAYVKSALDFSGNKLYDETKTKELKGEARMALSDWKDVKLREQSKGIVKNIDDDRVAKVFLREMWIRNEDRDGKFDLITECQGKKLRLTETDFTEVPFVGYSPNAGMLYSTSMFEDLIPLNKGIDILTALVEGYTRTTAIGRYLKQKLSKVSRILNEHGEIIEYEGQTPPSQMQISPLPNSVFNVINLLIQFMNETGASITAFGSAPKGVKAYKAIESMKQAEFSNMQDSVDLLTKSLEEMAEKIIDLGSKYFDKPVPIYHLRDGEPDYFNLVSNQAESYAANTQDKNLVPLSDKYMVKCQIESGLSYTEEGKRDTYIQLADKGYLPKEEVLKVFGFSNVAEIMDRLDKEAQQKAQLGAMKGGQLGKPAQPGQPKGSGAPPSIVESPEFPMLSPQTRLVVLKELGVNVDKLSTSAQGQG